MPRLNPIIAIDGPVGSGKSTTARIVADRLGFLYIDTGAMYRAVTLYVLEQGIPPDDNAAITELMPDVDVTLEHGESGQKTLLNGRDISDRIRDLDVTRAVSSVSAIQSVRERMTEMQRKLGNTGGVVMEGRDIGTVVFPDAEYKVYLDASVEVRAARRMKDLEAKGIDITMDQLIEDIRERDRANMERELAPLRKAQDAITIDTTSMTFQEQVDAIVKLVR